MNVSECFSRAPVCFLFPPLLDLTLCPVIVVCFDCLGLVRCSFSVLFVSFLCGACAVFCVLCFMVLSVYFFVACGCVVVCLWFCLSRDFFVVCVISFPLPPVLCGKVDCVVVYCVVFVFTCRFCSVLLF